MPEVIFFVQQYNVLSSCVLLSAKKAICCYSNSRWLSWKCLLFVAETNMWLSWKWCNTRAYEVLSPCVVPLASLRSEEVDLKMIG